MRKNKGRRIALLSGCAVAVIVLTVAMVSWDDLVARYKFRQQFEGLGKNAQGYREYRHQQTGIVFVWLPGSYIR